MALKDLKVAKLDELAATNNVDDYPSSGNKDEKVAALEAANVAVPETSSDEPTAAEAAAARRRAARTGPEMVVIDGVRYRPEDATRVRNKARRADNR